MRVVTSLLCVGLFAATAAAPELPAQGPREAEPTAAAAPAVRNAAITALEADLERLIASAGWRGVDRWGVMVVSLDRGDTLFGVHRAPPVRCQRKVARC